MMIMPCIPTISDDCYSSTLIDRTGCCSSRKHRNKGTPSCKHPANIIPWLRFYLCYGLYTKIGSQSAPLRSGSCPGFGKQKTTAVPIVSSDKPTEVRCFTSNVLRISDSKIARQSKPHVVFSEFHYSHLLLTDATLAADPK